MAGRLVLAAGETVTLATGSLHHPSSPHIIVRLNTKNPIEIGDFVGAFTSAASQYRKFIQQEHRCFPRVGKRASDWVRDQVARRRVEVRPAGKIDKYGRVIAYVALDGQDLVELLVKNGLGRVYQGERRMIWCPEP